MDENISLFSEDGGDKLTADDQAIFDTWREEPEKEPDGEEAPETKDSWDKETADLQEKAAPESKADQSFKLKVLGQEIEASRDEVIALAQKGKDYDRIRGKLSELTAREAKSGNTGHSFRSWRRRRGSPLKSSWTGQRPISYRAIVG